jgi:methylmalonyl-CoA mutase
MVRHNKRAWTNERPDDGAWRDLVENSLRGEPLDSLAGQSDDGISIGPIYDLPEKSTAFAGRNSNAPWIVIQRIDDPDPERAMEALSTDLNEGAGGIELVFAGSTSAARSGFGLSAVNHRIIETLSGRDNLHLRIDAGEATYSNLALFKNIGTANLTFAYDQLAHAAARGGFERPLAELEGEIVNATKDHVESGQAGETVVADGRVWAAGGASEAQELAGIMASFAHNARLLIEAGLEPAKALGAIGIIVDAGANQILTLAKLRALRLVHARIVEAFGLPPMAVNIHAETSWRMMTRHEVHTNILRTTSAAFAAGIGGADSLTILPFTSARGLPDGLSRRIARNSQIVLIEEAGLARVSDPGAGSGAIEALTDTLAKAAWEKFRALEAGGGLLAALRSGTFQREIAKMRKARAERIARREVTISGVSEFPNLEEEDTFVLSPHAPHTFTGAPNAESFERIVMARLAKPFEALRDRATALVSSGRPPQIFLAILGAPDKFAGATQAATDYFAAGGIATIAIGGLETPGASAEAFSKSSANTACIVSADVEFDQRTALTARALKESGAKRVYIIGGATRCAEIDASLDDGEDSVTLLDQVLKCSE